MKVKATVSFAGQICMALNEVRDIPDDTAAPLIACGYLKEVLPEDPPAEPSDQAKPKTKKAKNKKES